MRCLKINLDEWMEIYPYMPHYGFHFDEDEEEFVKHAKKDGWKYVLIFQNDISCLANDRKINIESSFYEQNDFENFKDAVEDSGRDLKNFLEERDCPSEILERLGIKGQ